MAESKAAKSARIASEPVPEPKTLNSPSFGMSEGTREELERTGHAVDPFTGRALTRDDLTA